MGGQWAWSESGGGLTGLLSSPPRAATARRGSTLERCPRWPRLLAASSAGALQPLPGPSQPARATCPPAHQQPRAEPGQVCAAPGAGPVTHTPRPGLASSWHPGEYQAALRCPLRVSTAPRTAPRRARHPPALRIWPHPAPPGPWKGLQLLQRGHLASCPPCPRRTASPHGPSPMAPVLAPATPPAPRRPPLSHPPPGWQLRGPRALPHPPALPHGAPLPATEPWPRSGPRQPTTGPPRLSPGQAPYPAVPAGAPSAPSHQPPRMPRGHPRRPSHWPRHTTRGGKAAPSRSRSHPCLRSATRCPQDCGRGAPCPAAAPGPLPTSASPPTPPRQVSHSPCG